MSAYELKNIAALTGKGADGRFISWGISKNEAVNISNNSLLEDKAVLQMNFGANVTPADVSKEGVFGGTYFRDICSSVN